MWGREKLIFTVKFIIIQKIMETNLKSANRRLKEALTECARLNGAVEQKNIKIVEQTNEIEAMRLQLSLKFANADRIASERTAEEVCLSY